jgi:hypothetical protein
VEGEAAGVVKVEVEGEAAGVEVEEVAGVAMGERRASSPRTIRTPRF